MLYLDNAATSWPKPPKVLKAMSECINKYGANPGRSGHKMAIRASEKIYECRENIAKLFNIKNPLCISFTYNTTEAINLGIKGVLREGDHVIISGMEHNSVLRPLKKLEQEGEIRLSITEVDNIGRINLEVLENQICEDTRLIVTIHASNVSGTINPIHEIGKLAHKKGIIFMVDAAQTSGVYPIDVKRMNIDILAFPGHKGLLGPQGTGGLYVNEELKLNTLIEGGTGSISESPIQPDFIPDRYESGTLNTPGIVGLNEGVKYILARGIDDIREHEAMLSQYLIQGLGTIDKVQIVGSFQAEERVGVISFYIEEKDCVDVANILDSKYNICVRGGLHCAYLAHKSLGTVDTGTVRIGLGIFNTKNDIDILVSAIRNITT